MKKLQIISDKIEKTNNNYFGRGSFETIIKENKEEVISWLENLLPVQEQIKLLDEQFGCENLQKRNYVRILTKIFPPEYNQFVCVNILLRDIDSITLAFSKQNDVKKQYNLLIENNRLKFPGKHQKYVDFETYQQFVILYTHDLINKSQDFETEEVLNDTVLDKTEEVVLTDTNMSFENKEELSPDEPQSQDTYNNITQEQTHNEEFLVENNLNESQITDEKAVEIINDEIEQSKETVENKEVKPLGKTKKDKTNWMNVLLKGI